MQYTAEQQAKFKREFAARRRRQMLVAVPFVALIVGFVALARAGQADGENLMGVPLLVWAAAFLALVVGVLVFAFRNWRCPACGKYLGREMGPRFCSKCGVALQ